MKWFKNRVGTQPVDAGSVAMDFDEVFSFKSLPNWWRAMNPKVKNALMQVSPAASEPEQRFNQYNGAPLPTTTGK